MTSPAAPETPLSLADIARALSALGYQPDEMLYDATLRMARVTALARDMTRYAAAGQPPADSRAQTPPELFRALPGNHTVASLVRDFAFEPVGAFLMGADLVVETEKSLGILANFIRYGYWVENPKGVRSHQYPPVAERYPSCRECGFRLLTLSEKCPCCGYRADEQTRDERDGTDSAIICTHCRKTIPPGLKFCPACGSPASLPGQKTEPPATCSHCGGLLTPGKMFCGYCGRKTR